MTSATSWSQNSEISIWYFHLWTV